MLKNRVGLTSDIHIDYNSINTKVYVDMIKNINLDYLIIAGDISNDIDLTIEFLKELSQVVTVRAILGNHEYYNFTGKKQSTLEKFEKFEVSGFDLGVSPVITESYVFIGNGGWHDDTTYTGEEGAYNPVKDDIEISRLKYSSSSIEFAKFLEIDLNNQIVRAKYSNKDKTIIPVSHIAPHASVVYDRHRKISNIFGCSYLHELYKKHDIKTAFYGHTHADNKGISIEGINYISRQLKYSFEWDKNVNLLDTILILEG